MLNEREYFIGEIEFTEYVTEEEKINLGKGLSKCRIFVNSGLEGNIPHFHLLGTGDKFNGCVRIYEARHFKHGVHKDELNRNQQYELNEWMKKPSKHSSANPGETNWDRIHLAWVLSTNPQTNVPEHPSQPDYSKMYKNEK